MTNKRIFKWYDPFLLQILPPIISLAGKTLLFSCHIVHQEGINYKNPAVYATWHQRMAFFARYLAGKNLIIMISQSRDGEYGAKIAKHLGFQYVRGSSTRGGIKALKNMINLLKQGNSAGILADGPLGPPRIAKMGPIIIARETGLPIIPIVWSCNRSWILNSWDRYIVPKPFAKVVVRHEKPLWVPKNIRTKEELEFYRKRLQDKLNECTQWCDKFFGLAIPWKRER